MLDIERLKRINNKARNLRWGSCADPENENSYIVVVGCTAYHGRIFTLIVNDKYELYQLSDSDSHREFIGKGKNMNSLMQFLFQMLPQWFPPKGVNNEKDTVERKA